MDKYDALAEEAIGWFDGWIMPGGQKPTPEEMESVINDIARVFRDALEPQRWDRAAALRGEVKK